MAATLKEIIKNLKRETLVEILDELKLERSILKDGGYGRSVRTPWKPTMFFRDSPTCPNFGETVKLRPCSEHWLWELVPEEHKEAENPCHYIPLNENGDTIDSLEKRGHREELEQALQDWLHATIERLEQELVERQAPSPK